MRLFHFAIIAAFAVTVSACSSTYIVRCKDGDHLAIHDSLYFGTAKPGGVVSSEDWAKFLKPQSLPVSLEASLPHARRGSGLESTVKSFEKILTCSNCFIPTTQRPESHSRIGRNVQDPI